MTTPTVSTYGSLQTLLQNMNTVQTSLNDAQTQISSNKVSQTFDGLGGNVEQFTAVNAQITRLTEYQASNTTTISQMQTTNTTLGQITTLATNIKTLIASQVGGTTPTPSFQQQLQADASTLSSLLNTTYGGNFLFGGTNTSTPPVKSPLPVPTQIGVPDTSYYQGSSKDATARIADGQVITPGVRADNPAFQQMFAGIAQAISAASTGSTTALQNAETLVSNGIQGNISVQATVNANIVTTQQADTQSATLQTYFQGIVNNINGADTVALSTQVAQDTTVLQASFSTFARISSLSIVSYLPQA